MLKKLDNLHEQRMKTDPGYRHRVRGDEFAEKKQYKQAAEEYRQALRHEPKDAARIHAKFGHALVSSQQPREGLKNLEKAIEMSNGKQAWLYSAWLYKGTAHGMLGEMDAAIKALTKSISLKPTVLGHVSRATAYAKTQRLDAALSDCETALDMKPENTTLWSLKARIHLMASIKAPDSGHKDKACHAMRKACELGECRPLNEFTECKTE
ncbi:MAG: tetratricopeptide repeat protein [Alphaproteobacteria bacterium]